MGVSISKYTELANNDLLKRFCSEEVICPNDPFWNQMLAFNINPPVTHEDRLFFENSTESLFDQFLKNNTQTGNLGSLIQVFITRATELLASPSTDNVMLSWQTFNALFVIRALMTSLFDFIADYELEKHIDLQVDRRPKTASDLDDDDPEAIPNATPQTEPQNRSPEAKLISSESRFEMLCDALVGLICDVPVTDNTYYLHVECINTLLVFMSTYKMASVLRKDDLVRNSLIYRTLYQGRYGIHAPLLVRTLLLNYCSTLPAPLTLFGAAEDSGSLVIHLASGIWNMLTFSSAPTRRQSIYVNPPEDKQELMMRLVKDHPLANQSCLLLLALTNHRINEENLYRKALLRCEDTAENASTSPSKELNGTDGIQITPPRIDMAALHNALCATSPSEHSTLLLYLLLHSCAAYRRHVRQRSDLQTLIIPILKCLYDTPDSTSPNVLVTEGADGDTAEMKRQLASSNIYMSLIVLLILTEDDSLTKAVHQIVIKNPSWYGERSLPDVSLGGLMVLVMTRAVQYNIVRARDKYLHTNCLAALANMSSEFRNLHPYVAQRLISLYETLAKRRARLVDEIEGGDGKANNLPFVNHPDKKTEELCEHATVLDEVLRMLLEILNSCLSHQLQNNLHLVYALLHKRHVFNSAPHPILSNIEMVIGYFSSRLQRVQEGAGGELGVTEVLNCIKKGAEQWSNDRLKKFPDLKFRYVEEDNPEEFFTPYVWELVSSCGAIYRTS